MAGYAAPRVYSSSTSAAMARALTIKNIYDKRYKTLPLEGDWARAMGEPEHNGLWLMYGKDKNGKTWFALKLADELSRNDRVLYVSAEEGIAKAFRDTCLRVGIATNNRRLHAIDYEPIEALAERLSKPRSARVVVVDNLTIYRDELKGNTLHSFVSQFPEKLFIFLAHEERNAPYGAVGKLAHKLAKIIIHIKGLSANIYGRCPGGVLSIDERRSKLYWGEPMPEEEDMP